MIFKLFKNPPRYFSSRPLPASLVSPPGRLVSTCRRRTRRCDRFALVVVLAAVFVPAAGLDCQARSAGRRPVRVNGGVYVWNEQKTKTRQHA